ncbi:TnsA endonuclease N-terminal domain-containing protein [Tunturiibacter gelidiferens]|uniref:TnsA endonuclease N-terminal domain-containing protein n=1 Tax=Tunturiibacter gelidiferens TaxID=3069689 RepID=UPI003D9B6263
MPIQKLGRPDGAVLATISAIQSIEFPEPGQLRARKVVTRSQSRSTGKYPSWKMGRMLQWESLNELNAFRLLDCDPEVTRFAEQPCKILYVHDGVSKTHFPDILVETKGCKKLWEIKPEAEAIRPEVASRTTLLAQHLPRWGYSYRVVLDHELARQPRLRNADRLLSFGRDTVTECEQEFIRLALKRCGALVWSDACAGAYGSRGREILCHLALNGTLSLDMNATWSADTRFTTGKAGI